MKVCKLYSLRWQACNDESKGCLLLLGYAPITHFNLSAPLTRTHSHMSFSVLPVGNFLSSDSGPQDGKTPKYLSPTGPEDRVSLSLIISSHELRDYVRSH